MQQRSPDFDPISATDIAPRIGGKSPETQLNQFVAKNSEASPGTEKNQCQKKGR
jgi:hypothetical protein